MAIIKLNKLSLPDTLDLSAKTLTLPASSVTAHATDYDDNKIQTNLALVAFKSAVNGSLAKYDLQDTVIDEFNDATGIDASASTNEGITSGGLSGVVFSGSQTQLAGGTGTAIGNMTAEGGLSRAFDGQNTATRANSAMYNSSGSASDPSYIGKNWGEAKVIDMFRWYGSSNDSFQTNGGNSTMTMRLFGNNTNDFSTATQIGADQSIGNARAMSDYATSSSGMSGTTAYQYHWVAGYLDQGGGAGIIVSEMIFWEIPKTVNNLTGISTATTASSQPSKADFVMLLRNDVGTATINTDIKVFVSRDNGSTYTEATLVDEGSYATNTKILTAHDIDISSQPSGTSMRYKITTHNQSAGVKETSISAVSFGWK